MGSIQLPPAYQSPDIQDPFEQHARVVQFRNQQKAFQTEQQGRELQLQEATEAQQDDQKARAAYTAFGQSGSKDPNDFLKELRKQNVGPKLTNSLMQASAQSQQVFATLGLDQQKI